MLPVQIRLTAFHTYVLESVTSKSRSLRTLASHEERGGAKGSHPTNGFIRKRSQLDATSIRSIVVSGRRPAEKETASSRSRDKYSMPRRWHRRHRRRCLCPIWRVIRDLLHSDNRHSKTDAAENRRVCDGGVAFFVDKLTKI